MAAVVWDVKLPFFTFFPLRPDAAVSAFFTALR